MQKTKSTLNTLSLRQLAARIKIDVGQLSLEAKRPGFPSHTVKGKKRFVLQEVIDWRARNIRQRKTAPGEDLGEEEPKGKRWRAGANSAFVKIMTGGDATAIQISRAAAQLASQQVAAAAVAGTLTSMDLDGLKKTLGELRQAENDYIELEKQKRSLIPRDEVSAIVAACCSRLVRALGTFENSIGTEFAIWLADPKVQAMPTDERARTVRAFVAKTCREIRQQEADGVDKLIDSGNQPQGDDE